MKKKIIGLFSCVLSLAVLVSCFGYKQAPTTTTTQTPVTTTASDQTTTPAPVTTTTTPAVITSTDANDTTTTTTTNSGNDSTHTHTYQKVAANNATCQRDGNIEYYVCEDADCGKYFIKKENEYNEVSATDVITKKLAHVSPLEFTFTSKDWKDSSNSWTSIKDGALLSSDKGVQITAKATGASAKTSDEYTISKVVVTYSTNTSSGAGSISIQVGNNDAISKDITKDGGTTDRNLEFDFDNQSGEVTLLVTCSTNSIYVKGIKIIQSGALLEHHASVAATSTESGCKEYWSCPECHKNYSDKNAENEISDLDAWASEGGDGYIAPTGSSTNPDNPQTDPLVDVITISKFSGASSSYQTLSATLDNNHEYEACIAKKGNLIQITKDDKYFACTKSNSYVRKVEFIIDSSTATTKRSIKLYGFNDIEEYDGKLNPITTLSYTGSNLEYEFTDNYELFGFEVTGGAVYIKEIKVTWQDPSTIVYEPADQKLIDALSNLDLTNIQLDFKLQGTEDFKKDALDVTYYIDNGKVRFITRTTYLSVTYEDEYFYYEKDGIEYLVFKTPTEDEDDDEYEIIRLTQNEDEDSYSHITSSSEDFEEQLAKAGYFEFDLKALDYNDFIKVSEGKYRIKPTKMKEIAISIVGDNNVNRKEYDQFTGDEFDYVVTEVFSKFTIEVDENGSIKITIISTTTQNNQFGGEPEINTGDHTYEITLSNQGKISFTIPNSTRYLSNANISNIYELDNGEQLSLESAYVNDLNTLEKIVYICDDTGAIAVHYNEFEGNIEIGSVVSLTGEVRITGELYELVADKVTLDDRYEPTGMMNLEITSLAHKNTKTFPGETVDFNYLTLIEKDIDTKNVSFKTYDNQNIRLIYEDSEIDFVKNIFKDIEVGSSIKFKACAISFDGEFIIRLLNSSSCELANGMICSSTNIVASLGTEIEDALKNNNFEVYEFKNGVKSTLDKTLYNVSAKDYDKNSIGSYLVTISKDEFEAKITIRIKYEGKVDYFSETNGRGIDYACEKYGVTTGIKSVSEGTIKVLVIPVEFTNAKFKDGYKEKLEKGFNGTSEDTGWESLKSYYYKSSYGKLTIEATVLDKYDTKDEYSYSYKTDDEGNVTYPDGLIGNDYYKLDYMYLDKAIAYYDNQIDYSEYDSNNDGYIDCVYLVYSCATSYESELGMWWAYTSNYYPVEGKDSEYDGLHLDSYMWFSIDFFDEDAGSGKTFKVNSETVIHESGHALGLDDYYDTAYTGNGGYGGGIMMDHNVGDHDPYSKAILGWINPYIVINKSCEITINSFESTGNAIFIAKDYDGVYFGEYYIVDLYTPTGLNALKAGDENGYGLPGNVGVRILHVAAQPKEDDSEIDSIWTVTKNSNSATGDKLISVVEADDDNSLSTGDAESRLLVSSDLWNQGQTLNNISWYDGTDCGFTISIKSISNDSATIVITFAE